jgi:hypothetical protein
LFSEFKDVDGVIFRIGESDGVDVKSDFASRIVIKNARQANDYIKSMLPVFEKFNKLFIFRTWSVGAYKIGDIMWNEKTFEKTFSGIESANFIISMKYGEADFFRHLELNELFFKTKCRKIVELQTRREYEGFGVYPSFIGWDYKKIYDGLKNDPYFSGIHVWCQTGGWSGFKNYTFLKNSSFCNELNTVVTLNIFKKKHSVTKAVKEFYGEVNYRAFLKFLKLTNDVINNLLYDPCFAVKKLYFNKSRVPTILHIFWDNITVTDAVIEFYNAFNEENKEKSIRAAILSLNKIKKIKELLPFIKADFDYNFYSDTFKIIAYIRFLIYKENKDEIAGVLKNKIKKYNKKYKKRYKVYIKISKNYKNMAIKSFIKMFVRTDKKYRFVEKFFFNPLSSRIITLFYKLVKKNFPNFSDNQAMPIETFFK